MGWKEEDEWLTIGRISVEFQAMRLFEMKNLHYCYELRRFIERNGEISLEKSFRNFQNTEMQLF